MFGSFAAIGDSFTEGLWDPHPDGSLRGWADLVANRLAELDESLLYANLAVRGRKLDEIASEQVEVVIRLRPALITVGAGANDIIRTSAAPADLGARFDAMLARLVDTQATVLAFAGFDPQERIPFTRGPAERAAAYNDCIRESVARRGALLVDLWDLPRLYEDRMWAPDRLHLSSDGHALVAAAVLRELGIPADFSDLAASPDMVVPPKGVLAARIEDVRWVVQDVLPWAYRGLRGQSSGDGQEPKYGEYVRWSTRFSG